MHSKLEQKYLNFVILIVICSWKDLLLLWMKYMHDTVTVQCDQKD